MVRMAVAVGVADVVEVGVIDAKRREKRMWRRLGSLVGWGFLVLVDMSVDGVDMAGEAAGHDVVEVVVAGVEAEARRPLFRLVYEGVCVSPSSLWFLGERGETTTLLKGKMSMRKCVDNQSSDCFPSPVVCVCFTGTYCGGRVRNVKLAKLALVQ